MSCQPRSVACIAVLCAGGSCLRYLTFSLACSGTHTACRLWSSFSCSLTLQLVYTLRARACTSQGAPRIARALASSLVTLLGSLFSLAHAQPCARAAPRTLPTATSRESEAGQEEVSGQQGPARRRAQSPRRRPALLRQGQLLASCRHRHLRLRLLILTLAVSPIPTPTRTTRTGRRWTLSTTTATTTVMMTMVMMMTMKTTMLTTGPLTERAA